MATIDPVTYGKLWYNSVSFNCAEKKKCVRWLHPMTMFSYEHQGWQTHQEAAVEQG
jgi:hypothetical protein